MMFIKYLLIFVSLLIVQAYKITAQQSYSDILPSGKTAIFKESFDSNNNKWVLDNLWLKGNVVNGYYDIVCKNYQKSTGLSYKTFLIDKEKDYEIEAVVNTLKGSGGLAFGITGKNEHYRIDISYKNTLVILKNTPSKGMNEKLLSGYLNSGIKAGSFNKITIRKLKDNFYIFLNEAFIGRFTNFKPEGDQIGFNVGLNSEISVDYLIISYLTSQTAPLMVEKNPTPPLITWIDPSGLKTSLDTNTTRIRANIKSGSKLKSALFYLNGASKGEGEIKLSPSEIGTYIVEKTILLNPGENNVYLVATNFEGESKSDLRYFIVPIIVVGKGSTSMIIQEVIQEVITPATDNYAIQLGAFNRKANADDFRKKLAALLDKEVEIFVESGFYKVRITGFGSRKEVEDCILLLERNDVNVMFVIILKGM